MISNLRVAKPLIKQAELELEKYLDYLEFTWDGMSVPMDFKQFCLRREDNESAKIHKA